MNEPIITETARELEAVGVSLTKFLGPGDIVYLEGELGSGKTTLSRGILRGFGYQGIAISPTYPLFELYELEACRVAHLDLYRITNAQGIERIGFRDYLDGQTIFLIEWPENSVGFLPEPNLRINLEYAMKGRIVRIEPALECLNAS